MGATIKDITSRIKRDIEGLFSFMEINLSQEEFKDYCDNVASIVVYINKATKADIDIKKPVSNVDKVTKTLLFPSELNDELKKLAESFVKIDKSLESSGKSDYAKIQGEINKKVKEANKLQKDYKKTTNQLRREQEKEARNLKKVADSLDVAKVRRQQNLKIRQQSIRVQARAQEKLKLGIKLTNQ